MSMATNFAYTSHTMRHCELPRHSSICPPAFQSRKSYSIYQRTLSITNTSCRLKQGSL
jgi:hypothetical protein